MIRSIRNTLLACILTSASFVTADDSRLDPVVVTATRVPTSLSNVVAPVIVIGRDEIERGGADDLAQILRFHAGVDIGRNGGPGQTTGVFMRGSESNHTLVLIDGVRMNPATIGGAALQNISPDIVERIEIVKGPRSSLYGSEAIGGVINVITRRSERPRVELAAGAGRYGSRQASAALASRAGGTHFDAVLSYADSDGFPARDSASDDSGHDNLSAKLGARWAMGKVGAEARLWQAQGTTEYLNFFGASVAQDYVNQVAAVALSLPVSESWESTLDVSLAVDDIEQNQVVDFAHTRRVAADWKNVFELVNERVILAGVYIHDESAESLVFGSGFDRSTDVVAAYFEDNHRRGPHTLSYAGRYTDHQSFGGESTWHFDYGFDVTPRLTLTAGASRGFRAPDATDRFGFGGNPDLDPETSTNLEAGARLRLGPSQRLEFSAYSLDIDDLIIFEFDPLTFLGRNANIEKARVQGLEARYVFDAGVWGLRAAAVVQDPENVSSGTVLPRRARRSASVNAYRRVGSAEIGVDLLASGRRKDSDFSPDYNAGYVLANLSARLPLGDAIELRGKIENLLDADYQTARGFNTPGRGVYLDFVYTHSR